MSPSSQVLDTLPEPLLLRRRQPEPFLLPALAAVARLHPVWRRPDLLLVLLVAYLAFQFLIPSRLVVGGLGAAGRPSAIIALVLGLMWVASWLCVNSIPAGRQPARWIVLSFLLVSLLSYAVAYARGINDAEARSADRHLILVIAMIGLTLAIADGVRDRRSLDLVLLWLTRFAGVMAAFGAVQAVLRINLTEYIRIPGLQANRELLSIGERGQDDLARVAGTANHYIEFGVVLAMITPIAVHYAMASESAGQRVRRWALTLLVASGIPFSISRSAVISFAVGLVVLALVWTWRTRLLGIAAALVATVVFQALQPGFIGTLRSLFENSANDPSVQNRLADYPIVHAYFVDRPWIGRGLATFLPDQYTLLDNELLYTLVTAGVLGLAAFVLLFVGGAGLGLVIRWQGADPSTQHLGQALAGALVAGFVATATFDAMSFPTFVGVMFLSLGAVGALYRLRRAGPRAASGDPLSGLVAPPLLTRLRHLVLTYPERGAR